MAGRDTRIRRATAAGAVALLAIFAACGAAGWWVIQSGTVQRVVVDHTHAVIETMLEAETALLEAVAERNQALSSLAGARPPGNAAAGGGPGIGSLGSGNPTGNPTGNPDSRSPGMEGALERARGLVETLLVLVADNRAQEQRALALKEALGSFAARLRETVRQHGNGAAIDMAMALREAGQERRRLLRMTGSITDVERGLLSERLAAFDDIAANLAWLFAILLVFAALAGGLGLWALSRHLRGSAARYDSLARSEHAAQAANAALAESEGQLQSILDHARDPILLVGPDGRIAVANPAAAAQFRLRAADMVGRLIQYFVPAYAARSGEVEGLRPDGTGFPAELSIGIAQEGGRTASVCVLRDVTERRRLEELKSEFVSTVSHELRTPLTSIRASLGLVIGGVAGAVSPEVRELLEIAHNNSERLVLLVNDILDMEKLESGRLEFRRERHAARRLLEQAVEANRAYGLPLGVSFAITAGGGDRLPVDEAWVQADAARIQQVLANLLSNAAKFSPRGGQVEVGLVLRPGEVVFRVRDHGRGIPPEFRDRIFQRFAQADSSDVRQKGGTGLGLSISRAIVEHHGGAMGFEDAPGGGTVFWFSLPRLAGSPPRATLFARPAPGSRRRALIVEDDADVALLLSRMLAQHGWDSEVARSAAEAIESLDRARFDALTLDLMLPDEDGLSLFRRLRQRPDGQALPVVVISARADAGKRVLNGDAVGVVDWLDKPVDQPRLQRALRQALQASDRPARILHVEDDQDILRVVAAVMGGEAVIVPARSLAEARRLLGGGRGFRAGDRRRRAAGRQRARPAGRAARPAAAAAGDDLLRQRL